MSPIGIVADDLTGATTVGALIAREGVDSTVLFDPRYLEDSPLPEDGAIIVSTDSRAMEPEVAFSRVSRATQALLARGVRQFSKRTDTTLRGGIGPEIEGMLSALPSDYLAIIVPAMPQSRRIVVGGFSLIDSELLSRTGVAQDVRTPVTESHVPTLLASQLMAKLGHVPIQAVMAGKQAIKHELVELRREGTRAFVLDAVTTEDIDQIAQAVVDLRWKVICVDPGPFTDRLAVRSGAITPREGVERARRLEAVPGETGTVLLVAGSATAVTHEQFSALREVPGTVAVSIDVLRLIGDEETAARECQRVVAEVQRVMAGADRPRALVMALDTVLTGHRHELSEMEQASGLRGQQVSNLLNTRLGQVARGAIDVFDRDDLTGVYLTGGDVMVNCCRAFDARGITLVDYVIPQVDQGVISGGPYSGVPLVCKGGLTGSRTTTVESVNRLFDERMRTRNV